MFFSPFEHGKGSITSKNSCRKGWQIVSLCLCFCGLFFFSGIDHSYQHSSAQNVSCETRRNNPGSCDMLFDTKWSSTGRLMKRSRICGIWVSTTIICCITCQIFSFFFFLLSKKSTFFMFLNSTHNFQISFEAADIGRLSCFCSPSSKTKTMAKYYRVSFFFYASPVSLMQ